MLAWLSRTRVNQNSLPCVLSRAFQKRVEAPVEGSAGEGHVVAGSANDGTLRLQFAVEQIADGLENGMVTARGDQLGKRCRSERVEGNLRFGLRACHHRRAHA